MVNSFYDTYDKEQISSKKLFPKQKGKFSRRFFSNSDEFEVVAEIIHDCTEQIYPQKVEAVHERMRYTIKKNQFKKITTYQIKRLSLKKTKNEKKHEWLFWGDRFAVIAVLFS